MTARRAKGPAKSTPPAEDVIVVFVDKKRENIRIERNGVNPFEAPKLLEAASAIADRGIGLAPSERE